MILLAFLVLLAALDCWRRAIPHHVWLLLIVYGLTLPAPSFAGATVGVGLLWLAGLPAGDRYVGLGLGLILGPSLIAAAVGLALAGAWAVAWWRQLGFLGHPFLPYLSGATLLLWPVWWRVDP